MFSTRRQRDTNVTRGLFGQTERLSFLLRLISANNSRELVQGSLLSITKHSDVSLNRHLRILLTPFSANNSNTYELDGLRPFRNSHSRFCSYIDIQLSPEGLPCNINIQFSPGDIPCNGGRNVGHFAFSTRTKIPRLHSSHSSLREQQEKMGCHIMLKPHVLFSIQCLVFS